MNILWGVIITVVVLAVGIVAYDRYGDGVRQELFGQADEYTIYVNRVAFSVSVADDKAERQQGLSGVASLPTYGGKLFIFDTAAQHGIWMKDMQIPLDILWFDENFTLIHIEENVLPETYPAIFSPTENARYVLEINAFAAQNAGIGLGSTLTLPTAMVPYRSVDSY
jgi:uncharacterized protein